MAISRSPASKSPDPHSTSIPMKLVRTWTCCSIDSLMSPELVKGDVLDPRADQYSLGVIAWQALTGTFPFRADSPITLLANIAFEPPDLSSPVGKALTKTFARSLFERTGRAFPVLLGICVGLRGCSCYTRSTCSGKDPARSGKNRSHAWTSFVARIARREKIAAPLDRGGHRRNRCCHSGGDHHRASTTNRDASRSCRGGGTPASAGEGNSCSCCQDEAESSG